MRSDFPETLLWLPFATTRRDGGYDLDFSVADSLTEWEVAVLATTRDGQIANWRSSFQTSLPLALEMGPPDMLTEGDLLQLPVVVRNHSGEARQVHLSARADGSVDLGKSEFESFEVASESAASEILPIRAGRADAAATLTLTLLGDGSGDAVSRKIRILPNAELIQRTQGAIGQSLQFPVSFPPEALSDHRSLQLRLFPGILDQMLDALDQIAIQPHGCAEQIASLAYLNLRAARLLESAGRSDSLQAGRVRSHVQSAVEQFGRFENEQGAYSYFPGGPGDLVLTAHVVAFLREAEDFLQLEPSTARAEAWLRGQPLLDGSPGDRVGASASVIRQLSRSKDPLTRLLVKQFLDSVADQTWTPLTPATLADLLLAAIQLGDQGLTENWAVRLVEAGEDSPLGYHWLAGSSTAFLGRGRPGTVETTARALQTLAQTDSVLTDWLDQSRREKLLSALLFLARQRDRQGVWFSGQATLAVMEAALALQGEAKEGREPGSYEIRTGDRILHSGSLSSDRPPGPISVKLDPESISGDQTIRVDWLGGDSLSWGLLETRYHVPWRSDSGASGPTSDGLGFDLEFDRTAVTRGEWISGRAHVSVRRVPTGRPMLMVEIGLPPGAELDREMLESQRRSSGSIGRFEYQPGKLIAYGYGSGDFRFDFRFRLRFAGRYRSQSSRAYDYYNPDEEVRRPPVVFEARVP